MSDTTSRVSGNPADCVAGAIQFIKERWLLIVILASLTVIHNFYIIKSTANIVYMDQMYQLAIVDKFLDNQLTLEDVLTSHSGHRSIAYIPILLLNAAIFNFNTQVEMHIGSLVLLATCIIMFRFYRDSLPSTTSSMTVQFCFIPMALLIFSLIQWENIVFSNGTYLMLRMAIYIINFAALDAILVRTDSIDTSKVIRLLILLFLTITVIGSAYYPALVCAMATVTLLDCLRKRKSGAILIACILATTVLATILYKYGMADDPNVSGAGLMKQITGLAAAPAAAVKFFILSFGGSVFGVDLYEFNQLSKRLPGPIGIAVIFIYLYSIITFFRSRMYEKTFMPLFFIFYAITLHVLILTARFSYGSIYYGMSSRYTTDTQYGIIAVVWIFAFSILTRKKRQSESNPDAQSGNHAESGFFSIGAAFKIIVMAFIFSGYCLTQLTEWKASPYRKAYYENLIQTALNIDSCDDSKLQPFQSTPDLTRNALRILQKHNLNVFFDHQHR